MKKVPFEERKSVVRGLLDVVCGCYPSFLVGGRLGDHLPVFHFHDVSRAYLTPYFQYLADNQYRTVTSDEISAYVKRKTTRPPKRTALCFDDAWGSLYTVVYPLLKEYGLRAITYVIPGRLAENDHPFCSWEQLREMQASGLVDVQAHTFHHAMIFSDPEISGFVTSAYQPPLLSRPIKADDASFYSATDVGAPLYQQRSSMSDACRLLDTAEAFNACTEHVRSQGPDFFLKPDWEHQLRQVAAAYPGRMESREQRNARIRAELIRAKETLNEKLQTDSVRHLCFPWAVAGHQAERTAADVGYETAFADRLFGRRYVSAGDNPYRLMRLKHQYIRCLPGTGRKALWSVRA